MTKMLNIFSGAFWPFVTSIKKPLLYLLPIFKTEMSVFLLLSFIIECFICPEYKSFISYVFCKYFLPIDGFLIHFLYSIFWWEQVCHFDEIYCISFSFYGYCLLYSVLETLLTPKSFLFFTWVYLTVLLPWFVSSPSPPKALLGLTHLAFFVTTIPLLPTPQTSAVEELEKQAGLALDILRWSLWSSLWLGSGSEIFHLQLRICGCEGPMVYIVLRHFI